jgi:cation diffusion facilitator family transporter
MSDPRFRRVRLDEPDTARRALYRRAVWLAIGGNLLLVVVKGVAAWLSGSSAVFSDAANSAADTLYSLLMGLGLYLAQQPPDETHPQGHARFEPLVSLLIATAMLVAAGTALWESVRQLTAGGKRVPLGWATAVLLGSIAVKLGMYVLVRHIARQARSPAIHASARDNLADSLSSLAALIGVLGSQRIHPLVDPLAGLLVALWIVYAAWEIVKENLGYLTGQGGPEDLAERIVAAASQVAEVVDVHQVITEYVGPQVRVDMHINVDGSLSLVEAHLVAEQVREVVEGLPEVGLAFIHIEPTSQPS